MKAHLYRLKNVDRIANSRAIEIARGHGDLSENADYSAAKEEQGLIEAKIRELEAKTALAEVIDPTKLSGTRVKFGATVTIEDAESGRPRDLRDRRRARGRHQEGPDLDRRAARARADRQGSRTTPSPCRAPRASASRGHEGRVARRAAARRGVAVVNRLRARVRARARARGGLRCMQAGRAVTAARSTADCASGLVCNQSTGTCTTNGSGGRDIDATVPDAPTDCRSMRRPTRRSTRRPTRPSPGASLVEAARAAEPDVREPPVGLVVRVERIAHVRATPGTSAGATSHRARPCGSLACRRGGD